MNTVNRTSISWIKRILVGKRPLVTFVRTLILAACCALVFKFVFRPVKIDGHSMAPTVKNGAFRFVNLLAYAGHDPQRGDIVVIEKDGFNTMYLKRVIGLPGESIRFENGTLHIDGKPAPEPYLQSSGDWNMKEIKLKPDSYLVAGDNRTVERKKHVMGIVDRKYIQGKLLWR